MSALLLHPIPTANLIAREMLQQGALALIVDNEVHDRSLRSHFFVLWYIMPVLHYASLVRHWTS